MMGATKWQLLWRVKIPLALPVMMLGLNQTIMYAIAMLVIAALVGTNGLEQIVYIGLSDGNFGIGNNCWSRDGNYRNHCRPHDASLEPHAARTIRAR